MRESRANVPISTVTLLGTTVLKRLNDTEILPSDTCVHSPTAKYTRNDT